MIGDLAHYAAVRLQKGRIPKALLQSVPSVERHGEDPEETLRVLLSHQPAFASERKVDEPLLEMIAYRILNRYILPLKLPPLPGC